MFLNFEFRRPDGLASPNLVRGCATREVTDHGNFRSATATAKRPKVRVGLEPRTVTTRGLKRLGAAHADRIKILGVVSFKNLGKHRARDCTRSVSSLDVRTPSVENRGTVPSREESEPTPQPFPRKRWSRILCPLGCPR